MLAAYSNDFLSYEESTTLALTYIHRDRWFNMRTYEVVNFKILNDCYIRSLGHYAVAENHV